MATELIANGSGAASSSYFTLADGERATVFLSAAAGVKWSAKALVEIKNDAGVTSVAGRLGQAQQAVSLVGPGAFRARRLAGDVSFGVFRG